MSRLASRSPAAPFQTSRPAPVTPQRPPQSTDTTEAQTLRQMLQEREEKIRELEEEIKQVRGALAKIAAGIPGHVEDLDSDFETHYDKIREIADNALDGGGDEDG